VVAGAALMTNLDAVLWRFSNTGVLDTTFNSPTGFNTAFGLNGSDQTNDLLIDSNGIIWVAGQQTNAVPNADMCARKYFSDGTLDGAFAGGGVLLDNGTAGGTGTEAGQGIAMAPNGDLIVAGHGPNLTPNNDMIIWRFDQNGNWVNTFGTNGRKVFNSGNQDYGYAVVVDNAGYIYVAGTITNGVNASSGADMAIWKYDALGNLQNGSFGANGYVVHDGACGTPNGADRAYDIKIDNIGRLVVAGMSNNGTRSFAAVWRYLPNGSLDTSFMGTGYDVTGGATGFLGNDLFQSVVFDNKHNILLTGSSESANGSNDLLLARYTDAGNRDMTFNAGN
jgi:uncharacterized delta-60 repeat protein